MDLYEYIHKKINVQLLECVLLERYVDVDVWNG